MQETIFTILTDPQARQRRKVRASLDREFSSGVPWFDIVLKPLQATAP